MCLYLGLDSYSGIKHEQLKRVIMAAFCFSLAVVWAQYSFPNISFRDIRVCVWGRDSRGRWVMSTRRISSFGWEWGARSVPPHPRVPQLSGNNTLGLFRQNSFLKVFFFFSVFPLPPLFLLCYNVFSIFNRSRVNFLPLNVVLESKVEDVKVQKWTGPHINSIEASHFPAGFPVMSRIQVLI